MEADLETIIRSFYTEREFRLLITRLRGGLRAIDSLRARLPRDVLAELMYRVRFLGELGREDRAQVELLIRRLCGADDDEDVLELFLEKRKPMLKVILGDRRRRKAR